MAVVCDESCQEGKIGVIVRVGNQGTLDMRKDVPVSIYSEINGSLYLIQTQRTQQIVSSGRVSEALGFTIDPLDVPDHVLVVMVDDEGGYGELAECKEDNNLIRLEDVKCE